MKRTKPIVNPKEEPALIKAIILDTTVNAVYDPIWKYITEEQEFLNKAHVKECNLPHEFYYLVTPDGRSLTYTYQYSKLNVLPKYLDRANSLLDLMEEVLEERSRVTISLKKILCILPYHSKTLIDLIPAEVLTDFNTAKASPEDDISTWSQDLQEEFYKLKDTLQQRVLTNKLLGNIK